jgi:hypothetical protein
MAVVTPAGLRGAIAALIATVPSSGQVHQQRRVIRDERALKTLLADPVTGRICGWMISPSPAGTAIPIVNPGYVGHGVKGGGNVLTTFQFQIEGFYGLDDASNSEQTFADLAWAVCDEFNAYGSIPAAGGGAIAGLDRQLPTSIEQFGYIMFAGAFLLHYARLELGFIGRTRPNP